MISVIHDDEVSPGYPFDANVRIRPTRRDEEDSDEGISIEATPGYHNSSLGTPRNARVPFNNLHGLEGIDASDDSGSDVMQTRMESQQQTLYSETNNTNTSNKWYGDNDMNSNGNKKTPYHKSNKKEPSSYSEKKKSPVLSTKQSHKSPSKRSPGRSAQVPVIKSSVERPQSKRHVILSDNSDNDETGDGLTSSQGFNLNQTTESMKEIQGSYQKVLNNISRSDIDLRKHEHIDPHSYKLDQQRTVSLSQADVQGSSLDEGQDALGDLHSFGQPRPSQMSPLPGKCRG